MKDERLGLLDIINVYEQTKRLSMVGINENKPHLHPSHSLFRLNNDSSSSQLKKVDEDDSSDDDNDNNENELVLQEQQKKQQQQQSTGSSKSNIGLVSSTISANSAVNGGGGLVATSLMCSSHLTSIVHDHDETSVLENESIRDYLNFIRKSSNAHHSTIVTSTSTIVGSTNNNPDMKSLEEDSQSLLNSKSFDEIREYLVSNLYNITYLLHHSTAMSENEMLEMIQMIEHYHVCSSFSSASANTSTTSTNHSNSTFNSPSSSSIDFKKDLIDSKTKCTLLHTASKFDFLTVMQYLLDKQPELLESKDRSDATPIFYACSSAHSKSVTMLAINGAQLNTHDKYEASPLSVSLNSINKSKGFTVARTLLGFHIDIEYKVYCGNTILHLACREGDLEKVQFIVEDLKHSIFRKNSKQESCLFRAVKHEKISRYLLEYCEQAIGREKLLKLLFMKNDKGQTIVHHCCSKGYMESMVNVVKCLVAENGNIKDYNVGGGDHDHHDGENRLELLFNEKDSVYGLTPLHVTVLAEQEEIFELLIRSKEIQLDSINKVGDTPLHIAVRNEKLPFVKELYHLYSSKSLQIKNNQKKTIEKLAKERDIDLKKLEREIEQDNASSLSGKQQQQQKEGGFWRSLFSNGKKKKSQTTKSSSSSLSSSSSSELQSRMSNVSRRNSLLVSVSWDPSKYAVGNDQIDSQHSQLIEWLKNLSEASLTSQSHWVVGYTIGCLIEYTEFHFEDEEELMLKYRKGLGEEYVKKHQTEHLTFTSKMKAMQKDYLKNHATSLDIELLNYLINWLVKHINFTDRKLVEYINTHNPDD